MNCISDHPTCEVSVFRGVLSSQRLLRSPTHYVYSNDRKRVSEKLKNYRVLVDDLHSDAITKIKASVPKVHMLT